MRKIFRHKKRSYIQSRIYARVDCPDTVYTDVKWISFILNQLILNAVKYRRDPEPEISIFTEKTSHGVRLTVADNGVGIPEADLPRIFERFYRVDKARSRAAGGTGLGLSIVSDTVKRRGGAVEAANRPGGGAVFTVRWPALERREDA